MNQPQVQLVQQTFALLAPRSEEVAAIFYERLFDLDPSLRALFRGDIKRQGTMLVSMLATAVRGLEKPDALVPVLKALGKRHSGYGVVDQHYVTVGLALVGTLEKGLGPHFNAEVRKAWVAAYTLIASTMKQGAREMDEMEARAA